MLTRESFFAVPMAAALEPVETAAGTAYVRTLTVGEKDAFDKAVQASPSESFRARLVVMTVCDADGRPIFRDGDVHRIADYPLHVVEPLVDAAIRINKLRPEDVEELEKNWGRQAVDSSTG